MDLQLSARNAYAARRPALNAATDQIVDMVTTLLDDAGINYLSVAGRTKSVASFAAKAARIVDGKAVYDDPLQQITDQIGVRVITYLMDDVHAVAELLSDQFVVLADRDMGLETASQGRFGYNSRHLLITLDPDLPVPPSHAALRGHTAQVQIRTVLQHAWAEFEHDIRYKGSIPAEHASDLDRRFTLAAGLLELADREFSMIRDQLQESLPVPDDDGGDDPRISPTELAAFLSGRYTDAGWSRTDHYAWIDGLLLELGITSVAELSDLVHDIDDEAITERMGYKYPPGAVRRLDDALLNSFGEDYIALHGNAHRTELLTTRLARLRGEQSIPTGGQSSD